MASESDGPKPIVAVETTSQGVVSFHGIAVEAIAIGAAVQIELDTSTGRMSVRPLRAEDLRKAIEGDVTFGEARSHATRGDVPR